MVYDIKQDQFDSFIKQELSADSCDPKEILREKHISTN